MNGPAEGARHFALTFEVFGRQSAAAHLPWVTIYEPGDNVPLERVPSDEMTAAIREIVPREIG